MKSVRKVAVLASLVASGVSAQSEAILQAMLSNFRDEKQNMRVIGAERPVIDFNASED